MAAVMACGPSAALSHLSAAVLWGVIRDGRRRSADPSADQLDRGISHVTVPGEAKSRPGIKVHRSRTLFPGHITRRLGIPVTTPSRTLTDLRRTLPQPQFARVLREAEFLGLPIGDRLEPDHTRSELETRFLALCRRHRLPQPEVNQRVGPYVVDFLWPDHRLVAEVDGYEAHRGRGAFESDRARDIELKLLGLEVVRFTWHQLTTGSKHVATTLRTMLNA
jgi:very-short-patch-repair endonuclease